MAGCTGGGPAVRSPDSTLARMLPLFGDAGGCGDARATAAVKQSGFRALLQRQKGRTTDTIDRTASPSLQPNH